MIYPVTLYCKSFSRDLPRVKELYESIVKYNKDGLGFIVSVPASDVVLFTVTLREMFPHYKNWDVISDQEIVGENLPESWRNQQVVKMMFWKHSTCEENYVVLDSDCYFIKDFYAKDFIIHGDTPYTVIHEQKDLFTWTTRQISNLGFDPKKSFGECREPIQALFDRQGRLYDFGPVPVIWSSKVWQSMEEEYLKPNDLTFQGLIDTIPSEFSWYGEWLLVKKPIELWPIEPMFKVFHYLPQYHEFKNQGYTEQEWANNYLGLVLQSSSNLPLKY
jgi:hypothetical protein